MRSHGLSQVPVAKNELPLSAAEVMGSVDELWLMEKVADGGEVLDRPVEEVMGDPLPTVGSGQPVELAMSKLDNCPALLVLDGGRPCSVLTRTDILRFLSPDSEEI
jgi:cystathionine beta-synthase